MHTCTWRARGVLLHVLVYEEVMAAVPSVTVVGVRQDRRCTCISELVLPVYSIQRLLLSCSIQSVRPELSDSDELEDLTGLETLIESEAKYHTALPWSPTTANSTYKHVIYPLQRSIGASLSKTLH